MRNAVCESVYLHKNIAKFNMICAVMDRIDSAIKYLNEHYDYPESESLYLTFMAYACMVCDSYDALSTYLRECKKETDNSHIFFGDLYCKTFSLKDEDIPCDDKLFAHIRSISFAHPFQTDRSPFLKRNKITQFSPMTIVQKGQHSIDCKPYCVCVWIYQNDGKTLRFDIPWTSLLLYIQSRYNVLSSLTNWINNKLENQIAEWKTQKINRSGTVPEILQRIIDLIHDRYEPLSRTFEDDWENSKACMLFTLLRDYTLELTDSSNVASVERYRKAIADAIPELCEIMDNVGDWDEVAFRFLLAHPKTMHPKGGYELEKIHSMKAGDYRSTYHGRKLAADFAKGFSSKWVNIDAQSMPVAEIQLLANVACYLEAQVVGEREW